MVALPLFLGTLGNGSAKSWRIDGRRASAAATYEMLMRMRPTLHIKLSRSKMAGELGRKRVGFLAGVGARCGPLVVRPYRHWSPTTSPTRGSRRSSSTIRSHQLKALAGCSGTKCRPASSWSLFTSTAKPNKIIASARRRRFSSSEPRCRFNG